MAPQGHNQKSSPGFYDHQFLPQELRDLELALEGGLKNEINLLRVATRRFFEIARETQDLEEAAMVLRTLALTAVRVSNLERAQEAIGRKADHALDAIAQALQEVLDEWELRP